MAGRSSRRRPGSPTRWCATGRRLRGNLVNASPAADTAPPLLALGAEVELSSRAGTRRVPLDDFWSACARRCGGPTNCWRPIRWPVPPARSAAGFYKIGLRKADACSVDQRGRDGRLG